MKYFSLILIIFSATILSCDDDDSGGDMNEALVTFKANGLSIRISESIGAVYEDNSATFGDYELTMVAGTAELGTTPGKAIIFSIVQSTPITAGTYTVTGIVPGDNVTAAYSDVSSLMAGALYTATAGSITITEIDLAEQEMEGSFSFTFEKDLELPSGSDIFDDPVEVTEGLFDDVLIIL